MSANGEQAVDLLKSIDASLKQLVNLLKQNKPKEIADARDLDGQWGDPVIKAADPRDWSGPEQKGKRFSQCSSEYLELVASRLDYFADVAEREDKQTANGKPVAPLNRRDAARARGWAKRVREGWQGDANGNRDQAAAPADDFGAAGTSEWDNSPKPLTDDDIPF